VPSKFDLYRMKKADEFSNLARGYLRKGDIPSAMVYSAGALGRYHRYKEEKKEQQERSFLREMGLNSQGIEKAIKQVEESMELSDKKLKEFIEKIMGKEE
jgi:hypothetical protein